MKKLGLFFFKYLNKLMTLIAIFWLGSSIFWLQEIAKKQVAWSTILCSFFLVLGLFYAYIKCPKKCQLVYVWLINHKILLTLVAVVYQVLLLVSAAMMIRSDAAVVFNGAIRSLGEHNIASYLTRNPNNMALFLYERFFYNLFGTATIWVLQGLNIAYTHCTGWLLYHMGKKFTNQRVANRLFFYYWLLILMTPKFMAMYTDILSLPLLTIQLYGILILMDANLSAKERYGWLLILAVTTGVTIFIRPTSLIVVLAFFMVSCLTNGRRSLINLLVFTLAFGVSYATLSNRITHQREVTLIEGEGLSKNLLTFINLGLTFSGTDQEDMQKGLASYLPEERRDLYNNGRFHNDYQIAEIKRRLKAYNPLSFALHTAYKQYLTTGQGNLNWIYKDANNEKTVTMSPLTDWTKSQPFTQVLRDYFIYTDQPKFQYYDTFIQWIWIIFSVGLLLFFVYYGDSPRERFLSLALFGGLLFLQIFEGGKSRYLIQFLPQILLISAMGFEKVKGRKI